ncbi:hypothetical protein K470DRAFT_223058 [Piedraia hortae CBS 480.64]|uniref:tRNA(Phe) 7-[(3-amino-3-carboxypropyl)-4-demethylwyosine(37)-N(4)]-methyltransferase n=1 Tax=Piedraia hortae CBS 480.64 TaxID=1314780 RepID=A0A6A7BQV9_9PEZI|nr:hypothetical protein K470DRAFT_223058 [Piedraia hortae CBS 480.64]
MQEAGDEARPDRSPAGCIDVQIRDLVDEINAKPDYITTSSCAGRCVVYLEGGGSKGGKGGGRWLYTTHEAHTLQLDEQDICKTLGLSNGPAKFPQDPETARYVHFKFEPMILHMRAATVAAAQKVLTAALQAGFRESGAQVPGGRFPLVAVRSSGLALDCLVGFIEGDVVKLMVEPNYLQTLMGVASKRFEQNTLRIERFRQALAS